MSTRYPGGFINRSAPVIVGPTNGEGGSAPGVWTLEQASYYTKQGTWPQRVKARYLYTCGDNTCGQLGQNDTIDRSSPVQVGSDNNWSKVTIGGADNGATSALALKSTGTLWGLGDNSVGQLGTGGVGYQYSSPVQIGALTTWSEIANQTTNGYCSYAIKTDGTLWSWGSEAFGALGQGALNPQNSPVQVGSLTTWLKISAGNYFASAIKTDGTLWSWGYNAYGGVGDNTIQRRSSPVQVGTLNTWSSVSNSYLSTFAIKTDGTLWAWGYNGTGELAQNNIINRSSPVQIGALTTWASTSGNFAIKTDGTLWAWGDNVYGQLGQNNTINKSSPVQVGSLTTWSSLGRLANCANLLAIKTDGTMWGCGKNYKVPLATAINERQSSPVQIGNITWSVAAITGSSLIASTKI